MKSMTLKPHGITMDARGEVAERWKLWRAEKASRVAEDRGKGVSAAALFEALTRATPADAILPVDVGNNTYSFGRYFEPTGQQRVLMSGYLGSIGFSFPAAMGAWAATQEDGPYKGRKVISVSGDGGFGQYAMEFTTAVKYGMNITHADDLLSFHRPRARHRSGRLVGADVESWTEFVIARYNYWIVIILMMIGLYTVFARGNLVKKIVGLNIFQTSVFIFYITIGKVAGGTAPIYIGDELYHGAALQHTAQFILGAAKKENPAAGAGLSRTLTTFSGKGRFRGRALARRCAADPAGAAGDVDERMARKRNLHRPRSLDRRDRGPRGSRVSGIGRRGGPAILIFCLPHREPPTRYGKAHVNEAPIGLKR